MNPMRRPGRPVSAITASLSPGLIVGDVHVDAALELCQFVAERGRAQVPADAGELALFVAERGLDHEVRDLHAALAPTAAGSGRCRR